MPALDYPFVDDKPYIPIVITNPATNLSIVVFAMIDTGADTSVFPENIITPIGCKVTAGRPNATVGIEGTRINTWYHPLVIHLVSPKDRKKIVKSLPECEVQCTDKNHAPPLLGTINFLSHFNLSVLYKLKITRLSY